MKSIVKIFLLLLLGALSPLASAALNVFACEPEWGALAQELGGDKVSVYSATTAQQDAHHIEARPSLIARARNADLMICSGSELEIGWVPLLLTQAGNNRIQPGSPGYLEASQLVERIEIPSVIDRSLGDIHPAGNPHVHTDPRNMARVAEALAQRFAQLDPADAATFKSRADSFKTWLIFCAAACCAMIPSGLGGSGESHAAPCSEGRQSARADDDGCLHENKPLHPARSRGALADNIVSPRLTRKGYRRVNDNCGWPCRAGFI